MDQNNPTTSSNGSTPEANPISPQPLNTDAGKPTEMPMGSPAPVGGAPSGEGLPVQLPSVDSPKPGGGSGKMIMMVAVILLVIGILGAAGYYFYSMQNSPAPEESVEVQDDPDLVQLQTETDQLEVDDPQADITQVTTEINMLEATPSASVSSSARPR